VPSMRGWVAPAPVEPLARLYIEAEPFREFMHRWLAADEERTLDQLAADCAARYGGTGLRIWLDRALNGRRNGRPRLNLYLVDEVLTLIGVHPIQVYGDRWWNVER